MVYIAILVPLATWMLKGFFDGIPPALDEAAMVDGCTRFGAFRKVTLPLILPGLTSVIRANGDPRLGPSSQCRTSSSASPRSSRSPSAS